MALLALAALILGWAVVPRAAVFLLRHRSIVVGRTLIPTCSRAGRPLQWANRLHASEVRTYLVRVACAVSLVVFSRIAFQILPPLLCLLATLGAACMGVALLCDLVARIIPWEVSAALLVLGAVFALAQRCAPPRAARSCGDARGWRGSDELGCPALGQAPAARLRRRAAASRVMPVFGLSGELRGYVCLLAGHGYRSNRHSRVPQGNRCARTDDAGIRDLVLRRFILLKATRVAAAREKGRLLRSCVSDDLPRHANAVDSRRHNAARIARALAARVQPYDARCLQRCLVANDADGG